MDLGTALIIVSLIIAVPLSTSLWFFVTKNNKAKTPKTVKDTLETVSMQNFRAAQESYEMQIRRLKEDNISLARANSRYKEIVRKMREEYEIPDDKEDEEDLLSKYDIDWVRAAQVGQQLGLDTTRFDPNNPALTKYIADKILEHLDLALFLGIIKPKGFIPPTVSTNQTPVFNTQTQTPFESL